MLSIQQIIDATNGDLLEGDLSKQITSVCIDSRKINPGDLYVAICGKIHDGHKFIDAAVENGASAILVSQDQSVKGVATVRVEDTTRALGLLAKYHRRQFDCPIIAITGSAGKTTVKNLLADILAHKFTILKNERSENNWIGVPLTLFKMAEAHTLAVIEIGTNQPGDIEWLSNLIDPAVAILTNIGDSHLEGLIDRAGVFNEKTQLLKFLPEDGVVVYNADDAFLSVLKSHPTTRRNIGFSIDKPSDYQAVVEESSETLKMGFTVASKHYGVKTLGRHQIYNALIGICCGELFGVEYNKIKSSIEQFHPDSNRGCIQNIGDFWLCDDTYNANPVSMASALDVMSSFDHNGKKILVCADMLELGKKSEQLHRKLAHQIVDSGIDRVFTYGPEARYIISELECIDADLDARHCDSHEAINAVLKDVCTTGDLLLVKGSRSMYMEKIVDFVLSNFKR